MSESAAPDEDVDYLADAPPATRSVSDEEMSDGQRTEELLRPIARPRAETPERPAPSQLGHNPVVARQSATSEVDVRIGLWGAPRSGKTTYLSALRIAAQKPVMGYDWNISGCDPASADFLNESVKRFVRDKDFPMPNRGHRTLSWRFEGTRHRAARGRFAKLRRRLSAGTAREVDVEFAVEMQDAAGESFGEGVEAQHATGVHEHLMNAAGIVYLFDPIGNKGQGTRSFDFYFDTVERLKQGMRDQGLMAGSRLPHFLSVCVTKFDHPEVFTAAMDTGVIYQEHEGAMPVVPSSIAPEFLRGLCQDDASRFVFDALTSDFAPERISYFATSAVGFYLNNGTFNIQNFSNVADDGRHFLSAAVPVNVLEPIISLERRVRQQGGMA